MAEYVPDTNVGEFENDMDVPSKRTNADRIRAMSVEELARKFAEQTWRVCPPLGNGCQSGLGFGCKKCWLDWLNQEVSDGGAD